MDGWKDERTKSLKKVIKKIMCGYIILLITEYGT